MFYEKGFRLFTFFADRISSRMLGETRQIKNRCQVSAARPTEAVHNKQDPHRYRHSGIYAGLMHS